jgi:hypothetical protein
MSYGDFQVSTRDAVRDSLCTGEETECHYGGTSQVRKTCSIRELASHPACLAIFREQIELNGTSKKFNDTVQEVGMKSEEEREGVFAGAS